MMRSQLHLRLSAAVCLGGFVISSVACSTTMKVNDAGGNPIHWRAQSKTIVVFGAGLDDTDRRALEDAFVTALIAHGVRAMPSYKLFPGILPSGKEAHAILQQAAVDGALVSRFRVVTSNMRSVGGGGVFPSWSVLQMPGWEPVHNPNRIADGSVARFETSLWDVPANKMVWSANTRMDKPSLAEDFVANLTQEVVPAMVKAGA